MYAEIAIGATLPLHYYEGLHDQILDLPEPAAPYCLDHIPCPGDEAGEGTNISLTGNVKMLCLIIGVHCFFLSGQMTTESNLLYPTS